MTLRVTEPALRALVEQHALDDLVQTAEWFADACHAARFYATDPAPFDMTITEQANKAYKCARDAAHYGQALMRATGHRFPTNPCTCPSFAHAKGPYPSGFCPECGCWYPGVSRAEAQHKRPEDRS